MASLRLVHLLRRYARRLTVIAPLNCASAATMLALGADTIEMGPLSYLTAVDTSLEHDLSPARPHEPPGGGEQRRGGPRDPALEGHARPRRGDGVNPYQELYKYLHPLVIGALDRASSLSLMLCREILGYHMKDAAEGRAHRRRLNSSYPAHQYPITSREARRLGLDVQDIDPGPRPAAAGAEPRSTRRWASAPSPTTTRRTTTTTRSRTSSRARALQVFYQVEKDWHYRKEERRWVPDERRLVLVPLPDARRPDGQGQAAHPLVPRRLLRAPRDSLAVVRCPLSVVRFRCPLPCPAPSVPFSVRSAPAGSGLRVEPRIRSSRQLPPSSSIASPATPAGRPARRGRTSTPRGGRAAGATRACDRSTPREAKTPSARRAPRASFVEDEHDRRLGRGLDRARPRGRAAGSACSSRGSSSIPSSRTCAP